MFLEQSGLEVHTDFTVWEFDFALSFSVELPATELSPRLPAPLRLFEVRPGIGLMNLTVFLFTPGNERLTRPCAEVICSIHVIPDQRQTPVPPKMALYALQLGASSHEFLRSEYATDRLPFLEDPLRVRIDRVRPAVEVADAEGNEIFHAAPTPVDLPYQEDLFYSQTFARQGDTLLHGGNYFEVSKVEHQKREGFEGRLYPHPFFHGIDVTKVGPGDVYAQMASEPGSRGREYYFWLEPLA